MMQSYNNVLDWSRFTLQSGKHMLRFTYKLVGQLKPYQMFAQCYIEQDRDSLLKNGYIFRCEYERYKNFIGDHSRGKRHLYLIELWGTEDSVVSDDSKFCCIGYYKPSSRKT